MPRYKNLTYEQAALVLLHKKYPGLILRGGANLTENKDIDPNDPNRYIRAVDIKKPQYNKPERRKLNIPDELKQALDAVLTKQPIPQAPQAPEAPEALPMAPPFMPREARIISDNPQQLFQSQQMMMPFAQRNIVEELKQYKDGLKYLKSICPLLKRTYVRKSQAKPLYKEEVISNKNILKSLERIRKADEKYGY
jgi:hypothetical protein